MSQQLELLTENPSHWTTVCYIAPDIHKKEIKPFLMLALKELEGNPDSRLSSLTKGDKFAAIRQVLRHTSRLRSATNTPWRLEDINTFLESLRFSSECISELAPLLCADQMYENVPQHLQVKPGLAGLQWKIDISLRPPIKVRAHCVGIGALDAADVINQYALPPRNSDPVDAVP